MNVTIYYKLYVDGDMENNNTKTLKAVPLPAAVQRSRVQWRHLTFYVRVT